MGVLAGQISSDLVVLLLIDARFKRTLIGVPYTDFPHIPPLYVRYYVLPAASSCQRKRNMFMLSGRAAEQSDKRLCKQRKHAYRQLVHTVTVTGRSCCCILYCTSM